MINQSNLSTGLPPMGMRRCSSTGDDDSNSTIALIICYELFQRDMINQQERDQFKSK